MVAAIHGGIYVPPGSGLQIEAWNVTNPSWAWWRRSGRGDEPARWVSPARALPEGGPWAGGLALPRYDERSPQWTIDRTSLPKAPVLEHRRQLRGYQQKAITAWRQRGSGVLRLPCGAGKTTIGLDVIAGVPSPALVLMHTLDLVEQWARRVEDELGLEAVVASEGRRPEPGRVTLATVQTLARWDWWERAVWGRAFGLLVVDEAHHTPASTFVDVVLTMPALYRLGLTATPTRADGLTSWLWSHLGSERYGVEQADLQAEGAVLVPEVRVVETGWLPSSLKDGRDPNPDQVRRQRMRDTARNVLLADTVAELVRAGHQVLVLADQVPHVQQLAELTGGTALHGELSKGDRCRALQAAAAGRTSVLVATSVADEGLDLPSLSALVLAVPSSARAKVEQRVGRILRPCPGKPAPVVVDVLDADEAAQRAHQERARVYRKLGAGNVARARSAA